MRDDSPRIGPNYKRSIRLGTGMLVVMEKEKS